MKRECCVASFGTLEQSRASALQNESYFGWSWTAGTASWVEPTSYAMVCLRATRAEVLPATAERRLRVGEALLFDRMCPGGGWNCGNPMVYGVPGEPQVASTVWAFSRQGHPDRPEVQQSVRWLEGKLPSIQSPASLAARTHRHECIPESLTRDWPTH